MKIVKMQHRLSLVSSCYVVKVFEVVSMSEVFLNSDFFDRHVVDSQRHRL